jgi:hypothetical protein
MRLNTLAVACGIQCLSLSVLAEESLGDVIDRTAQRLSSQDVATLIVDHWIKWTSPNGLVSFQVRPNPGGMLQGSATHVRGFSGSLGGSWEVKDDGKFCWSASWSVGTARGDWDRCVYWFRIGDDYWTSASADDRTAGTFKYKVGK